MSRARLADWRAAVLAAALLTIGIRCCSCEQQYPTYQPHYRSMQGYPAQRPPYENDNYNTNIRRPNYQQDVNPTWRRDGTSNIDEQFSQDLVRRYVSDKRSKFVVATSSSAMGYLLGMIISLTILSRIAYTITITLAAVMFGSVYLRGEIAEVARALGVALLLFLKQIQLRSAIWGIQRYLRSAIGLARRKSFPPSDNPWSFAPDTPDMMNFTMTRTLYALGVIGLYFGWSIGRKLPLVPSWLPALASAIALAYFGTARSPIGDLLRYVGACAVDSVLLFRNINNDVLLTQRAMMLGRRMFSKAAAIDQKYELRERIGKGVSATVDTISDAYGKVQADIQDAGGEQGMGSDWQRYGPQRQPFPPQGQQHLYRPSGSYSPQF